MQLSADGARILAATLALGPVAELPFRVRAAEAALLGEEPLPTAFGQAALIAQTECRPRQQPLAGLTRYRQALIPVMLCGCLAQAADDPAGAGRAPGALSPSAAQWMVEAGL